MRIALFCDGTWNDPSNDTNVFRMFHGTPTMPGLSRRFMTMAWEWMELRSTSCWVGRLGRG